VALHTRPGSRAGVLSAAVIYRTDGDVQLDTAHELSWDFEKEEEEEEGGHVGPASDKYVAVKSSMSSMETLDDAEQKYHIHGYRRYYLSYNNIANAYYDNVQEIMKTALISVLKDLVNRLTRIDVSQLNITIDYLVFDTDYFYYQYGITNDAQHDSKTRALEIMRALDSNMQYDNRYFYLYKNSWNYGNSQYGIYLNSVHATTDAPLEVNILSLIHI
jgi:hypothetical protein